MTLGLLSVTQSANTSIKTYAETGSRVEGNLHGAKADVFIVGLIGGIAYSHASVVEGDALLGVTLGAIMRHRCTK